MIRLSQKILMVILWMLIYIFPNYSQIINLKMKKLYYKNIKVKKKSEHAPNSNSSFDIQENQFAEAYSRTSLQDRNKILSTIASIIKEELYLNDIYNDPTENVH